MTTAGEKWCAEDDRAGEGTITKTNLVECSGWRDADRRMLRGEVGWGGKWLQKVCDVVQSLDVLERGREWAK